ncbi:S-layer family protein [Candidatus Obscuribacterales bacterium]|nr:S-layer family protein [Candidatus Obscuribacterales bacterium]
MSKKIVRENNYFSRRWFAVIAASCAALASLQSAHASERREAFRDFRDNNPGLARNEARRQFNEHFGGIFRPMPIVSPSNTNLQHKVLSGGIPSSVNEARGNRHSIKNSPELRISNRSTQTVESSTTRLDVGINLDLSSTERNITLGQKLFDGVGSVQITVGGETKTVQAGSQVSAAEYVAVKQILGGGAQEISLDNAGRANGGKFDLAAITSPGDKMRASNFVLPENVTTYGDFSRASDIRLTGDLDNYGSIYAIASEKRAHSGTIHADDITNHEGALISSNVPIDLGRSLGAHARHVDLGLNASGELTNYGTISSSGNLTLSAASGNITNTGLIESTGGDISFSGSDAVLSINNTGGMVVSKDGAIGIRESSYTGTANTYVSGGDFQSRQFNTNAGQGTTYVDVNNISGLVNQIGNAAHVEVAGGNLTIGEVCLTGDPTYRNQNGAIQITGNISVAEALTIIARNDIFIDNNVIISAGNAAQGFNVNLIAGANIIATLGGADSLLLPPLPASSQLVTFDGASVDGGSIIFGSNTQINTRSTTIGNTNGGSVLLAAYAGTNGGGGFIDASSTTISTGGRGTGANGYVDVIAGAQNGTAISMGTIISTGSTGGGGGVNITAAQPRSTNDGPVSYGINGQLISTDFVVPGLTVTDTASVNVKSMQTYESISIKAGNLLGTSAATTLQSTNGSVGLQTGGSINLGGNIVGNNVVMIAGNDVSIPTQVSTSGGAGLILIQAGDQLGISGIVTAQNDVSATASSIQLSGTGSIGSSNGDITLSSANTIIGGLTTLISAPNGAITMSSATGNIGVNSGLKMRIDGQTLNATAVAGSVFISDIGGIDVASATASNRVEIFSVDGLSNSGLISGDIVNLQSTADAITLNADVVAGTSATLKANTDLVTAAPARVTAPQLYLSATSADIGGGGFALPFRINADNLVVSTPTGGAIISDSDSLNFGGGSTFVNTSLIAIANDVISNTSIITGNSVSLASLNSTVNVTNTINGTTSVTLQANSTITNSNISAPVNTEFLSLGSTAGDVGTTSAPFVSGASRTAAVAFNGDVYLSLTNNNARVSGSAFGTFDATANGSLQALNISGVDVRLQADGALTTGTGNTVTATNLQLVTTGDVGQNLASNFVMNAQNVDITAGAAIFVANTSATPVTLNSAVSTDTLAFAAQNANLASSANFSQNEIYLQTGGVFSLSGNLQNNGVISLTSAGAMTNAQFTGAISTDRLALESTNSTIGTNSSSPFVIADGMANIIRANSPGLGGIFIQSLTTDEIALTESSSNLDVSFAAAGPLRIIGDITSANGNVNLSNQSGTLTVSNGVTISAFDQINLINSGTNKKTSKIAIEADATIVTNAKTAGQGNVTIQLGAPQTKIVSKPPKNVVIVENNGGTVEVRGKGLRAAAPVNTLTADGATLLISNGINSKNLTLGGNVQITADPQVSVPTQNIVIVNSTTGGELSASTEPSGSIVVIGSSSYLSDAGSITITSGASFDLSTSVNLSIAPAATTISGTNLTVSSPSVSFSMPEPTTINVGVGPIGKNGIKRGQHARHNKSPRNGK